MAKKNISKKAQSKLIKKIVTKSGKPRFFKDGKRLPDKAGAVRFKNQQIALNRFRFSDGRFVDKNVQRTIVNNPELKATITDKVLSNNRDFFDVTDNETALDILDAILSRKQKPDRFNVMTFIKNDEVHPRDDFKFKLNQPIAIYELLQEIRAIKPQVLDEKTQKEQIEKAKKDLKENLITKKEFDKLIRKIKRVRTGVKLKVIKEDGSEVIGKEAGLYLAKWNIEKFQKILKKYPDAVGGVIKYPHKFVSPYLVVDLRLVNDTDIDVFNSEPRRRGKKGEVVALSNK